MSRNKEIIEYNVVYGDTVELLKPKVNELIREGGWQPFGRAIIEAGVKGVFQTMVRYGAHDVGLRDSTWKVCRQCNSPVAYINGQYRCGNRECDRYYDSYPTKIAWNAAQK